MPSLFSPDVNFNIQPESPVAPVAAPTSFVEGALNSAGSFLQEEVRARRYSGRGSEGKADPNLAVFAEEVMKVESIRQDRGDAAAALAEKAVAQNFAEAGYDLSPSYQRVYSSITGREFKSYGVDPVEQARQQTLASPEAQTLLLKQSIMNPNGTPQEWEEATLRKVNEFQANSFYLEQAKFQDQANFVTPSLREDGVVISNQQAFIQHADLLTSSAMDDLYSLFKSGRRPTEGQVEEVSIAVNAQFGRLERPKGITDDQWAPIEKRRNKFQEQIDRFKKVASNEELSSRFGRLLVQVIEQNPNLTPQDQALAVFGFLKGDQTVMSALLAGGNAERIALAVADPGVQKVVEGITPFFPELEQTITPGDTGKSVPNPDSPLVKSAQKSATNMTPQSAAKLLTASRYGMKPFKPENLSKPENSRDYTELAIQLGITIGANPDKSYLSSDFLRNTFNQDMWRNLEALQAYDGTYAAVAKTYLLEAVEKETARQNISIGSALRDSAFNIDDAGNIFLDFSKILGREGRYSKEDTDYFKEQMQKVYNNDLAEAVRTRFRRIPERRGTNVGVMRIVQELNLVDGYNQVSDRTKALQVLRDARIRLSTPEQQELSNAIRSGSSFEPTATDQKVQSLLESLPSFSLVGKANAATIESVVTAVPDVTSEEVTSAVDAIQAGTTLAEIQALGARQRAIMSSILNPVAPAQAATPTPRPRPDTDTATPTPRPRPDTAVAPAQAAQDKQTKEAPAVEMTEVLSTISLVESNNNVNAKGAAGEIGLFQIMPGTAADPGYGIKPLSTGSRVADATEAEQRDFVQGYINKALERYDGNLALALAAYNAGIGRVDQFVQSGRPLPASTVEYVDKYRKAGLSLPELNGGNTPPVPRPKNPPVPRPKNPPVPRPRPRPEEAGGTVVQGGQPTAPDTVNVNEIARDPRTGEPIFPAQDELATAQARQQARAEEYEEMNSTPLRILPAMARAVIGDIFRNQLGISQKDITRTENYFSPEELGVIRGLVEKGLKGDKTQGSVAYKDYTTKTEGVRFANDLELGGLLDPEFSVKRTLGQFDWKIDDRGHLIVTDKYDFNDAKDLQEANPDFIDKIDNLRKYARRPNIGTYGIIRRAAALFGSKAGEGVTFELDLGPAKV